MGFGVESLGLKVWGLVLSMDETRDGPLPTLPMATRAETQIDLNDRLKILPRWIGH